SGGEAVAVNSPAAKKSAAKRCGGERVCGEPVRGEIVWRRTGLRRIVRRRSGRGETAAANRSRRNVLDPQTRPVPTKHSPAECLTDPVGSIRV
ncbi:Uncharacterized protein FWK35_00039072, partial [Aphis craccivora]